MPKENRAAVATGEGRVEYVRSCPSIIRPTGQGTERGDAVNEPLNTISALMGPGKRDGRGLLAWTGFDLVSGGGLCVSSFVSFCVILSGISRLWNDIVCVV